MLAQEARAIFEALLVMFGTAQADPAAFERDTACVAQNIWFEARGSAFADKLAVGQVVMNRVADGSHASTPCEVIWEPKQFSWTHDGKSDTVRIDNDIDRQAWVDSVIAALAVTEVQFPDLTSGATHFHAHNVKPDWSRTMERIATYGGHQYYVREAGYSPPSPEPVAQLPHPRPDAAIHPREQLKDDPALQAFWEELGLFGSDRGFLASGQRDRWIEPAAGPAD